MKRSEAAEFIESLRKMHAELASHVSMLEKGAVIAIQRGEAKGAREALWLLQNVMYKHGVPFLVPCQGFAHTADAQGMQDHCSLCAPRWGWVGEKVRVT